MLHSNTPPVRNRAPLTARSSSLSTLKLAGQNPESISQEAIYHGTPARTSSRYQVFEKLLWKPSEDASQRSSLNQMSLTKKTDSFSTVKPIVNGGDWGCTVRDLETVLIYT